MVKLAWLVPWRSYWCRKSPALGDSPCLCSPGPTLSFISLHPPGMAHHSSAQAEGWYSLVLLRSWGPSQGWFIHPISSWQMPPPKKTRTYLGAQLKLWSLECIPARTLPLKGVWSKHSHMSYLFPLIVECFIPKLQHNIFSPKVLNSYFQDLGIFSIISVHSWCWCFLFFTVFFSKLCVPIYSPIVCLCRNVCL